MNKGKIIIISAPSGTGKSTIISRIIGDAQLNLSFSVSTTTRSPREGEQDGVHYYFITAEQFRAAIANDEFVEYEEVYPGRFYGTLKREIERIQNSGKNVILDIDVKGGVNVKRLYGDEAFSLFIQPPSVRELERRLVARATDSAETIRQRVEKAAYELTFASRFDTIVVNDNLDTAVTAVREKIVGFLQGRR